MINVDTTGPELKIRIAGDLEYALLDRLTETIESAELGTYAKIVVDLTGCRFMSSTATAKLIQLSKEIPYALEVVVQEKTIVHRVLDVSGMLTPSSPLSVKFADDYVIASEPPAV